MMFSSNARIMVLDLDGTTCNSQHRNHLALEKRWDEFHAASVHDLPNREVVEVAQAWDCGGNNNWCIALTGRNEKYRAQTERWLERFHVPVDVLLMRPDGDWGSDIEVKPRILEEWLAKEGMTKDNIAVILEDRDKVVVEWRLRGYRCWQVEEGAY